MSIRNSTKQAFADALKSLLTNRELSAVRVQELCRICGTERPTFYYHFRDKYDLIAWIYEQDLQRSLQLAGGRYSVSQLEQLLLIMGREQLFYRKAFDDSGQNALLPYILQSNTRYVRDIIQGHPSAQPLSREEEFQIHIYTYAWCGCLQDWIGGKFDFSAAQYARLMYRSMVNMTWDTAKPTDMEV